MQFIANSLDRLHSTKFNLNNLNSYISKRALQSQTIDVGTLVLRGIKSWPMWLNYTMKPVLLYMHSTCGAMRHSQAFRSLPSFIKLLEILFQGLLGAHTLRGGEDCEVHLCLATPTTLSLAVVVSGGGGLSLRIFWHLHGGDWHWGGGGSAGGNQDGASLFEKGGNQGSPSVFDEGGNPGLNLRF